MNGRRIHTGYLAAIGILLLINAFAILQYRKCREEKTGLEQLFFHTDSYESRLKTALVQSYKDEGKAVPDSVYTLENKPVPIAEILGDGPKHVFRMAELNCSSCVKRGVGLIDRFYKNTDGLIVLATYGEIKNLKIMIQQLGLKHPVYVVRNGFDAGLNVRELNQPYFFVLDGDLRFKQIFYLTEAPPAFVSAYFKNVRERFLSGN